jgi:hypothetical protein
MSEDNPQPQRDKSWSFISGPPQRYTVNYRQYSVRGGQVRPLEDILGFAPDALVKGGGDFVRFWFFCLLFDQIQKEGIAGDMAELGVYQGRTAAVLATMARRLKRELYLFDTFEGFSDSDFKGIDSGQRGAQFDDTSLEAVQAHVSKAHTGHDCVRYVKGYFPESATKVDPNLRYSLVHIDCDLYAPIRAALQYFYTRVVPGGFIIVHDYSSLAWAGAEKAVDEFFADKVESIIPLPDSAGSVVVRKARRADRNDNWRTRQIKALASGEWIEARNDALGPVLSAGWSNPENWGVWGVGPMHEIELGSFEHRGDIVIDADVHAFLPNQQAEQLVAVEFDNQVLVNWAFTADANRGVRSVRVPSSRAFDSKKPVNIKIQFAVRKPFDRAQGLRQIGIALHRLRVSVCAPGASPLPSE